MFKRLKNKNSFLTIEFMVVIYGKGINRGGILAYLIRKYKHHIVFD